MCVTWRFVPACVFYYECQTQQHQSDIFSCILIPHTVHVSKTQQIRSVFPSWSTDWEILTRPALLSSSPAYLSSHDLCSLLTEEAAEAWKVCYSRTGRSQYFLYFCCTLFIIFFTCHDRSSVTMLVPKPWKCYITSKKRFNCCRIICFLNMNMTIEKAKHMSVSFLRLGACDSNIVEDEHLHNFLFIFLPKGCREVCSTSHYTSEIRQKIKDRRHIQRVILYMFPSFQSRVKLSKEGGGTCGGA